MVVVVICTALAEGRAASATTGGLRQVHGTGRFKGSIHRAIPMSTMSTSASRTSRGAGRTDQDWGQGGKSGGMDPDLDLEPDLPVRRGLGVHRGGDGELPPIAQAPEALRVDAALEERAIPECRACSNVKGVIGADIMCRHGIGRTDDDP